MEILTLEILCDNYNCIAELIPNSWLRLYNIEVIQIGET